MTTYSSVTTHLFFSEWPVQFRFQRVQNHIDLVQEHCSQRSLGGSRGLSVGQGCSQGAASDAPAPVRNNPMIPTASLSSFLSLLRSAAVQTCRQADEHLTFEPSVAHRWGSSLQGLRAARYLLLRRLFAEESEERPVACSRGLGVFLLLVVESPKVLDHFDREAFHRCRRAADNLPWHRHSVSARTSPFHCAAAWQAQTALPACSCRIEFTESWHD